MFKYSLSSCNSLREDLFQDILSKERGGRGFFEIQVQYLSFDSVDFVRSLRTLGDVVPIIPLLRTEKLNPVWKMPLLYVRFEIKF